MADTLLGGGVGVKAPARRKFVRRAEYMPDLSALGYGVIAEGAHPN